MTFGDDIGGFKYVTPGNAKIEKVEGILDQGSGQQQDYIGSSLNTNWTRRITGVTRIQSQEELSKLSEALEMCLPVDDSVAIPDEWKNLRVKLEELYLENRDLGKSIDRGFQDLKALKKPGTEFLKKIWSELYEPLSDYIATEPSITAEKKEEIQKSMKVTGLSLLNLVTESTAQGLLGGRR